MKANDRETPRSGRAGSRDAGQQRRDRLDELEAEVERLRELALTDPLTGLPNRRAWDTELKRELSRARRTEHPLCVALIDLDHFKDYNDSHGHPAADRLLVEVARTWRGQIRDVDLLCRWGGDEFALLLPDCGSDNATDVLRRLVTSLPGAQRCSFGVACWEGSETAERLLDRVDRRLYRAKRAKQGAPGSALPQRPSAPAAAQVAEPQRTVR